MNLNLTLRIWRQAGPHAPGRLEAYEARDISSHMSFLEMLDVVNERLISAGKEPIAVDHDCREGICGACSLGINGVPHGPLKGTTTCQLHMRHFSDGQTITIEPWRARPFPVIRDLVVDRGAFDRIIQAGGYVSVSTGNAPDAHPSAQSERRGEAVDAAGSGRAGSGGQGSGGQGSGGQGTRLASGPFSGPCPGVNILEH